MFDSPAAIVVVLSSIWFVSVPKSTPVEKRTLSFSYMADTKNYAKHESFSFTEGKSMFDVSLQSAPKKLFGLRLGVSGMYDMQGTYLLGPGIGKTIDIGKFDTTLFVYLTYSSIRGLDRETASGQMNWKTTLDTTYRFDNKMKAGVGLLHISNGGYKEPNQGIEAIRFTLQYDF